MKLLRTAAVGLVLAFSAVAAVNTAVVPAPKASAGWMQRHESFLSIARKGGVDLLFVGDSITDYWRTEVRGPSTGGKATWDRYFAPLHAANFGISGDKTQDVLWRLQNGELNGITPRLVVLMIGTNNLSRDKITGIPRNTVAETAAGVTAVVREIRTRLPSARILLLGIFPRGQKGDPIRDDVKAANRLISALDDGRQVHYLDIGANFLEPDGTLSLEIMPDLLHPTAKGYRIWGDAIREPVGRLLR